MTRLSSSLSVLVGLLASTLLGASACSSSSKDGGPTSCPPGKQNCNGVCSNTQADPLNCGACGVRCDGVEGQACVDGQCLMKECGVVQ